LEAQLSADETAKELRKLVHEIANGEIDE